MIMTIAICYTQITSQAGKVNGSVRLRIRHIRFKYVITVIWLDSEKAIWIYTQICVCVCVVFLVCSKHL